MALLASFPSQAFNKAGRFLRGLLVRVPGVDLADSPTITFGEGAPTAAEPDGSWYGRLDGDAGTTFYMRVDGAWVPTVGMNDEVVVATVSVANATGGATGAALTLTLKRRDNTTAVASARQVLLFCNGTAHRFGQLSSNPTFGSATVGSIVASGNGWALVQTSAAGAFACTLSNSTDETLYVSAATAVSVSDVAAGCVVLASNSDAVVWSA